MLMNSVTDDTYQQCGISCESVQCDMVFFDSIEVCLVIGTADKVVACTAEGAAARYLACSVARLWLLRVCQKMQSTSCCVTGCCDMSMS